MSSKQRHVLSGASNIDVRLGNENIKQIDCTDYLAVKLDAHLTWNDQIDAVCKKLVFIISRLRPIETCSCYADFDVYLSRHNTA